VLAVYLKENLFSRLVRPKQEAGQQNADPS